MDKVSSVLFIERNGARYQDVEYGLRPGDIRVTTEPNGRTTLRVWVKTLGMDFSANLATVLENAYGWIEITMDGITIDFMNGSVWAVMDKTQKDEFWVYFN
jgi:hypothetical protein